MNAYILHEETNKSFCYVNFAEDVKGSVEIMQEFNPRRLIVFFEIAINEIQIKRIENNIKKRMGPLRARHGAWYFVSPSEAKDILMGCLGPMERAA